MEDICNRFDQVIDNCKNNAFNIGFDITLYAALGGIATFAISGPVLAPILIGKCIAGLAAITTRVIAAALIIFLPSLIPNNHVVRLVLKNIFVILSGALLSLLFISLGAPITIGAAAAAVVVSSVLGTWVLPQ